jgi:hypothetical protein
MARPSHPPRLDYSNYTWRRVQLTKLLVGIILTIHLLRQDPSCEKAFCRSENTAAVDVLLLRRYPIASYMHVEKALKYMGMKRRSCIFNRALPRSWLRHYTTNLKVTGRRGQCIFSIYLILPAALGPRVYSASNKIEYQKMFLGSRALPVRTADNLTAICEPII